MTRTFSAILLFTFGISISIYPILETGHEILHSFENDLHHHAVDENDHHHTLADHHLGEDHDHDTNEESEGANFISLLFGLSVPAEHDAPVISHAGLIHSTRLTCTYLSPDTCPPTPPPLG